MKHLSAMQVIAEVNVDTYAPTALSRAMTVPIYADGIPFW